MKQASAQFSKMANRAVGKVIQEIVDLVSKPDTISFAGAIPPSDALPADTFKDIMHDILSNRIDVALQYSSTYGLQELREELVAFYQKQNTQISTDELIVVSASQQALDLISKCFIDSGDKVICPLPSYIAAMDTFRSYGAELIGIPMDGEGMRTDILEDRLENFCHIGQKPKFIYLVPDFQNPTGTTTSLERRKAILKLGNKFDVLIVEDSPYRELRYRGTDQPRFLELAGTDKIITIGTFTKLFVPGIRLGWVVAAPNIIEKLMLLKQTTDICSSTLSQLIASEFLKRGLFDEHIKKTKALYQDKQSHMLAMLKKYMPKYVRWTEPEGGLFLFLHLSEDMSARDLLEHAMRRKVAYVPGDVFFCDGSGENTMRLNFSYPTKEQAEEGIKRLAEAIEEYYQNRLNRTQQEHYAPLEDFKSFEQIY